MGNLDLKMYSGLGLRVDTMVLEPRNPLFGLLRNYFISNIFVKTGSWANLIQSSPSFFLYQKTDVHSVTSTWVHLYSEWYESVIAKDFPTYSLERWKIHQLQNLTDAIDVSDAD